MEGSLIKERVCTHLDPFFLPQSVRVKINGPNEEKVKRENKIAQKSPQILVEAFEQWLYWGYDASLGF